MLQNRQMTTEGIARTRVKQVKPEAMTSRDRNSISSDNFLASTVDYSVAYSSDLAATINHNSTHNTLSC